MAPLFSWDGCDYFLGFEKITNSSGRSSRAAIRQLRREIVVTTEGEIQAINPE